MTLPLHGLRVLDLTRWLAGPFCTTILGDLGADVAKVEPIGDGDLIRLWGPFDRGISVYYLSVSRNKKSIAVNFRDPRGIDLIREMALRADVVVENFKLGTLDDMGLDFAQLRAANPKLICARITGMGSHGPSAHWPSVDQIAQGMSGLMSVTGPDAHSPTRMGVPIGDLVGGMWGAIGIQAAINQRHLTGQGQIVETSLLGGLVGLLCVQGQRFLSLGEIPGPVGNDHPVICPYGTFQAQDGIFNVAVANQKMWDQLCKCIGKPALANDARFANNDARVSHRAELNQLLNDSFKARTRVEWTNMLIEAGIPAGPIYNVGETLSDVQVLANGLVETIMHPILGEIRQIGNPVRLESAGNRTVRLPPPLLGQHTMEILANYGFAPERIAQLQTAAVVAEYAPAAPAAPTAAENGH